MDSNTEKLVDAKLEEVAKLLDAKVTRLTCIDKRHESRKIVIEFGKFFR